MTIDSLGMSNTRKQLVQFESYIFDEIEMICIKSKAISFEIVSKILMDIPEYHFSKFSLEKWLRVMAYNDLLGTCSIKIQKDGLWVYEYLMREEFQGDILKEVMRRVAKTADGLEERFTHKDIF